MKAIEFKGQNEVIAKNQPQYNPIPAFIAPDGSVVMCFEVSEEEKQKILSSGKIWLKVLTFGNPLQPLLMTADRTDVLLYFDEIPKEAIIEAIKIEQPIAKALRQNEISKIYTARLKGGLEVAFKVPRNEQTEKFQIEEPAINLIEWFCEKEN